MKRFIIERLVPGAGNLSTHELKEISKISISAMAVLGKPYTWVETFVTGDKMYCIHEAESEEDIREHSSCGNFPVHSIEEVKAMIGPDTAD